MIISGSLGQQVISHVHNLSQVDSIFIFWRNKDYHEGWTKNWSKIRGVFTDIGLICEALKQAAKQCEQNAISISVIGGENNLVEKNGNRLDPSFMYTQILKEILLLIHFEEQHMDEFIQYCRTMLANNEDELKNVEKLARIGGTRTNASYIRCSTVLYFIVKSNDCTENSSVVMVATKALLSTVDKGWTWKPSRRCTQTKMDCHRERGLLWKGRARSALFYAQAIAYYERSIRIEEQPIPRKDQSLVISYNNVGGVYHSMGAYPKALASSQKAFAIRQELLSPTHPDLAASYNNIGLVYGSMNSHLKALSSFEKASSIQRQSLPPTHPDLANTYSNIGLVHKNMGNYSKAYSYIACAVDIAQRSLAENHLDLQKHHKNLADVKKTFS